MLKTTDSLGDIGGKTVLARCSFDVAEVPDWRIDQSVPFLKELSKAGAKTIVLSHRGRPLDKARGKPQERDKSLSLRPVFEYLKKEFGERIKFDSAEIQEGEILLKENLRFDPREEANDDGFAGELAALGDFYVNNDFATAHRAHASIVGIAKFLPAAAGPLLMRETEELSAISGIKSEPLVFLLAGAKPETKLPVIRNFLDKADKILVGGVLANTFLKDRGLEVGKSLVGDTTNVNRNPKIILPKDVITSRSLDVPSGVAQKSIGEVAPDEYIVDIGPETQKIFAEILGGAARSVWNGALGRVEVKEFTAGSRACARAIVRSAARTTAGGGDTIAFIEKEDLIDKFEFVSTGGGAMLEFLAGEKLPALEALGYYDEE